MELQLSQCELTKADATGPAAINGLDTGRFGDFDKGVVITAGLGFPTSVTEPVASDLETLPGVGPGLIWMLNQCGINSLNALARQDPVTLSRQLGVVGQIVDTGKWVRFAKDG